MVSFLRNMTICLLIAQQSFTQIVPWKNPTLSASSAKLIFNCVPTVNNVSLSAGDYIGVFDSIDNCYGLGKWKDTTNYFISIYGSNGTTTAGFVSGSKLKLKIWLYQEDCIVENLQQLSATSSLEYTQDKVNQINALNFIKTSVTYPKQEYCINNAGTIMPSINYKPSNILFSAISGLSIDGSSGIIDPSKSTPGNYTIAIDANKSCLANKSVDMVLRDYPRLKQIPDTFICGNKLTISATVGFASLKWSTGQTTDTIDITEPTNVSYIVTNNYGCSNSDTFSVRKMAINRMDYYTLNADCEKKGRINITSQDILNGKAPYKYSLYNLVDNSVVTDLENVPEGIYRVNVINANGCVLSYNMKVKLEKDCLNDVPVFTPNADGYDDRFFISLEGKIKIYDRNGKLRRKLEGPVYFDGNDDNGHPLPMGTYLVVSESGKNVTLTIVK